MPGQERHLAPDRLGDARVTAHHARERRALLQKGLGGLPERCPCALARELGDGHVDHYAPVTARPVEGGELEAGIGVGQRGRLLGGDDEQRVGERREPPRGAVEPSTDVKHHVIVAAGAGESREDRLELRLGQSGESARARAPGENRESGVGHRGGERFHAFAAEQAGDIAGDGEADLHIDIGKPEIAVDQQNLPAAFGERLRQRDGKPGLAHAALAGGDCDQPPRRAWRSLEGRGGESGARGHRLSLLSGCGAGLA